MKRFVSLVLVMSVLALCVGCSSNHDSGKRKSHKEDRDSNALSTIMEEETESTTYDDYYEGSTVETNPMVDLPFDEAVAQCKSDALDYIGFAHYSRFGLYGQLSSPYTHHYPMDVVEEAITQIENEGLVDWNQEAFELATSLIDSWAYSYDSLVYEMTYCNNGIGFGFTLEEATNAVNRLEEEGLVDWNAEALEAAQSYLQYGDREYDRESMIEQLTFTGDMGDMFTLEQATYAVDELGM